MEWCGIRKWKGYSGEPAYGVCDRIRECVSQKTGVQLSESVCSADIRLTSVKALKNAYGEKYQACELCSRGQEPAGVVYITKKSNRFHNRESCSALKRSVRMVKETEVSGEMSACGRCG